MSEPETNTNSATKSSRNKRKRTDGLTYLGPKDKDFESLILRPSGVRLRAGLAFLAPESIPDDGMQEDPSRNCKVYLQIDDSTANCISSEFLHYHRRKYDETALTHLIIKWLARSDNYVDPDGPVTTTSLRRDIWKPGKPGPEISSMTKYTYDWDIEPDMTYMVSINMFEIKVREPLRSLSSFNWLTAEPLGVCPYLTFELKCAEKTGKESEPQCQLSAASVLWLSQWAKLKHELGSSDFSDLRHYSIVIYSVYFQIWVTEYNGSTYSVT